MDCVQLVMQLLNKEQKDLKMLLPRLTDCINCSKIPVLLTDIDCKLTDLAKNLYNNTVFLLNKTVQSETMLDLLNYKRILQYKLCNPDYACKFSVEQIASRVKLLHPIICKSNCDCIIPCSDDSSNSSTTSTTTSTTTFSSQIVAICLSYDNSGVFCGACGKECSTYYANSTCVNYIMNNNAPEPIGCVIYTDEAGTITAPNGSYSRPGGLCYTVGGGNGAIQGISNC